MDSFTLLVLEMTELQKGDTLSMICKDKNGNRIIVRGVDEALKNEYEFVCLTNGKTIGDLYKRLKWQSRLKNFFSALKQARNSRKINKQRANSEEKPKRKPRET